MITPVRSTLLLLAIGGSAVAVTLAWQHWTRPTIADAERQLQASQFLAALPAQSYDNHPLDSALPLPADQPQHSTVLAAYRATHGTSPTAIVLVSQVQGYAGPIRLSIAIDADGRLIGTRVVEQQESPGLGGRIADPQLGWLAQFAKHDLADRWAIRRDQGDFDQLAGATVTSRAVIQAQQEALRYFDRHRSELLGAPGHE
ncbi:RnfABCDGE type electron transport complex subunit G [Pseudomonas sp. LRP2-20]|uniref:RnfABCDGE type electron transport complex subunit G n=1 Tax=Pseudomonas sp. LRP2-20 TaxID=2944234 RepID=UPI00218BCA0C|nr:RnfABCDGE type electron transport complex subunit G [Pseudomonas sp. LRP2-20]BDM24489.1 RnfABCDGE type electron transport complex subunit G [Pseudomonas sp. LRP2-20]